MNKVLIVTYYWPPSGGAGVQRWLKFSKYLPEFGWEPFILTIDPDYATYPAIDPSLEKDIPASMKVFRTKATDWFRFYGSDKSKVPSGGFASNKDNSFKGKFLRFIRGNFFIPDPRRGWNRYAMKKASEILQQENIRYIITTSPPHSTQLIGLRLKKLFPEIIWIADLRDSWIDIYYYKLFYPSKISTAIDACYERSILHNADRIITVGKNLADTFSAKARGSGTKINVIPNGYDKDDFESIEITEPERFTITYLGTLSEAYPLDKFLKALTIVEKEGKDFLLRFVGNNSNGLILKIKRRIGEGKTEFISYAEHDKAIRLLASSSLLLLVIPETEKNKAITPGKLFEYIATGKPVLYIGPADGDAAYHLRICGHTGIFSEQNPEEIAEFIIRTMNLGESWSFTKKTEYSRRVLTQKLAEVLTTS